MSPQTKRSKKRGGRNENESHHTRYTYLLQMMRPGFFRMKINSRHSVHASLSMYSCD